MIQRAGRCRVRLVGFDDLQNFADVEKTTGGRSGKNQQDGREEEYDCREHRYFRSQVEESDALSAGGVCVRRSQRATAASDAPRDSWKPFLHILIT